MEDTLQSRYCLFGLISDYCRMVNGWDRPSNTQKCMDYMIGARRTWGAAGKEKPGYHK